VLIQLGTIITHGLPYPTNLETALDVENEIRRNKAIPATIGFLNGKLKVGLNRNEIEILAKNHQKAIKLSRRDLAFVFGDNNLLGGKENNKF
jgi:pseudouridine-5'-phosphate glycosidase